MRLLKFICLIILFAVSAGYAATGYFGITKSTTAGQARMRIAGRMEVASSSTAIDVPAIVHHGPNKRITVRDGATVATMTASGFYGNVLEVSTITITHLTVSSITATGSVNANTFIGDGNAITNLDSDELDGTIPTGLIDLSTVTTALSTKVNLTETSSVTISNALKVAGAITLGSNISIKPSGETFIMDSILQTGIGINPTNDGVSEAVRFMTNDAERMRIIASGAVGINETVPDSMLEVNGTFHVTGASTLDSTLDVTGDIDTAENYQIDGTDFVAKLTGAGSYGFGDSAGPSNSGANNIFIGNNAGGLHTSGTTNNIIGYQAMYYNQTGSGNTAMGWCAGHGSSGKQIEKNTMIGHSAGYSMQGSSNTLLGFQAGNSLALGSGNIIIGYDEDTPTSTTNNHLNIGGLIKGTIGSSSVTVLGDLYANNFSGDGSNLTNIAGDDLGSHIATTTLQMVNFGINTSSDISAARYQINGSTVLWVRPDGVFIGGGSGRLTSGGYNTFAGHQSGYDNTSGQMNTFVGFNAGYEHISGRNNTFVGYYAGLDLTTGDYNTLVGTEAGDNIIDGSENVFVGHSAGHFLTSGSYNIVIGDAGMWRSETGVANTLIGHHVAMGSAGQSFSNSTMVGYEAGKSIQTGSNNILIGYQAGNDITTGSSNIVIGFNENPTSLTGDNQLNIGGAITGGMLNTSTITFIGYLQSRGYSDTTPYPKEKAKAYAVVKSMKSDLDGSVDHDAMDDYIKTYYTAKELTGYKTVIESYTVGCSSCPGGEYIQEIEKQEPVYTDVQKTGRDISATISSQNEVLKDLIIIVDEAKTEIVILKAENIALEARLEILEAK